MKDKNTLHYFLEKAFTSMRFIESPWSPHWAGQLLILNRSSCKPHFSHWHLSSRKSVSSLWVASVGRLSIYVVFLLDIGEILFWNVLSSIYYSDCFRNTFYMAASSLMKKKACFDFHGLVPAFYSRVKDTTQWEKYLMYRLMIWKWTKWRLNLSPSVVVKKKKGISEELRSPTCKISALFS